jgi:hypothetical protein
METLRNALGFFEENGQIVVKKTRSGRQEAAVTLHPDWIPRYVIDDRSLIIGVFQMAHSQKKGIYGILSKEFQSHVARERIGIVYIDLQTLIAIVEITRLFQGEYCSWRIGLVSHSKSNLRAWRLSSREVRVTYSPQNLFYHRSDAKRQSYE